MTHSKQRRRRSLRAELLVNLGFVTSAAVMVVGLTTAVMAGGDLRDGWPLVALWLGSTAVFVLFGAYLVHRVVVRPLRALAAEADVLAAGSPVLDGLDYETAELAHLADRYRAMAANLLDVQSHVVRVEKLAGLGQLAAGVAHEVRNPLGALTAYVDVLRRRGGDGDVLDKMHVAIGRIDRTVQTLVTYARPAATTGASDLNAAVRTAADFLIAQGLLAPESLALDLEPELPHVPGSGHELEQVVLNLLINACQAAPGGRVKVGTIAQPFRPAEAERSRSGEAATTPAVPTRRRIRRPRRQDLAAGTPGVLLYVADTGPGVPEEQRERIFDPFFTTKPPGEGSGLGLAIVARAVHDAGGLVWVDPAREGGAVFKVFLPRDGATDAPADR